MRENTPPDESNDLPLTGEVKVETLGRYRILGELGRGGCGVVYRAMDPSIGRVVAVKTILTKSDSVAGRESRERFRREARSAGILSHPNIVTVHDFSDSGDPMFIAMEFVEGHTLADAMSNGSMPVETILGILRSAADALDYAHAQHIVHRDIKPANFLIGKNGRLKITDFGIAKILGENQGLTSTGMLVGTAQYMSPEQISEGNVTGRSDQFSLAVIAYEMLAGVKPFQGHSWATVIHAIIMAEPPSITQYRDNLSETVNRVLRKALSKDSASRYGSCTEFFTALERGIAEAALEHTDILPRPPAAPPQPAVPLAPPPSPASHKPPAPSPLPAVAAPREKEVQEPGSPTLKPILIGAIGGAILAGGLWVGLRTKTAPPAQPVAVQQSTPTPQAAEPVPTISAGNAETAPTPTSPGTNKKPPIQKATIPPIAVSTPQPVTPTPTVTRVPETPTPTPLPTVAPVVKEAVPTPTPPPAPVTKEDPAKRAAEEQLKQAAAQEQARRAAEDQAVRAAAEQSRIARTADFTAISNVLKDYQSAYERKDVGALQSVWPSIPKSVLEGIRGGFRDATEVSMDLRQVGEPKISGATATVLCDRNLRQVILKRVLQASARVNIVLVRAGSGWKIQSVDTVNK